MASVLHSWDKLIHRGIGIQESKHEVMRSGNKIASGFRMNYQISKDSADGSEAHLSNEYTV